MHKLAKGLKKKKKPKKGKKGAEEEEFDPEELERYRRERAEAQEKAATESAATAGSENSGGDIASGAGSDEWQKFQALTAGVDSILKKTQGDLDRIKSTSFFQRKGPIEDEKHKRQKEAEAVEEEARSKAKRWVGFDKDGNPIEKESQNNSETDEKNFHDHETRKKSDDKDGGKKLEKFYVNEEGFVDVPEDDYDQDDSADEDIFDTTYVDVLEKNDVQLAYIPDSPTEEELGDDPFDTTNADKVLKTVDKKGNKLVSLGNAVEVLSGRIDHVSTCKISRPRKNQTQDLLLDDTDFNAIDSSLPGSETNDIFVIEKTLLDDDTNFSDITYDINNLPAVLPRHVDSAINNDNKHSETIRDIIPLDISEFEILKEKSLLEEIPDLDDGEFDIRDEINEPVVHFDEADDDPFGSKETEHVNFEAEIIEAAFEVATFVNEKDPFDTTFADNILPGKTELKFIEKELDELLPENNEVSISLTDPSGLKRDYETGLLSSDPSSATYIEKQLNENKEDLLGGSCTDLTQLNDKPIEPNDEITYVDPFDTSGIRELPPGQTELKYLEEEILGESREIIIKSDSLDDENFDPRKEETAQEKIITNIPPRPQQPINNHQSNNFHVNFEPEVTCQEIEISSLSQERKASRPEILGLGSSKSVAFELPTPSKRPDLLQTSDEEKSISSKPLTPYYSEKSLEGRLPEVDKTDDTSSNVDPFDTSFVGKFAPGKTELKLIETELLTRQESRLKHSTSEQDFDEKILITEGESQRGRRQSDFGACASRQKIISIKEPETSLIEEYEIPTRQNIFEVNEAAHKRKKNETQRQESLLDAEVEVDVKSLTPSIETIVTDNTNEISYVDPFDTSIATNILPGKAELKLLENELSQLPAEVQKIRTNNIDLDKISARPSLINKEEDDFNPRADEVNTERRDFLSLVGEDPGDKVLTPVNNERDINVDNEDPFDTSFASIGPGKTELKLLESELMDK